MKIVVRPEPVRIEPPTVDPDFGRMNGLQRAVESLRYFFLRWERWVSPSGDIREWLRRNTSVGVRLLIPALFVMPVVGLILWQVGGWLALLTSIAGRLIVLPVLVLLVFAAIKIITVFIKR